MGHMWFKPLGWVYRPVSWQGIAAVLVAIALCVQVFIAIDRHSHSVSDTLYGVFPYYAAVFLLLDWLASRTSAGSTRDRG